MTLRLLMKMSERCFKGRRQFGKKMKDKKTQEHLGLIKENIKWALGFTESACQYTKNLQPLIHHLVALSHLISGVEDITLKQE